MGTTDTPPTGDGNSDVFTRPVPEYIHWLAGVIIALGGMALTVGGTALTFVVDRGLLQEGIESGEITVIVLERDLTEAQMLDLSLEIVNWTGIGLLVTGIGLVLFAIGYVAVRHRARREVSDDEHVDSYRASAVLGAVATAVLSFVPFSPVLGGGLAGYLEQTESGRSISVGGVAGFLSMVPALVILAFVSAGLYNGFATIGESGLGIVVGTVMVLTVLFVAAYGAGLGALGGFAGGRLAETE
ncbi:DUF5518 domain-containing protein [Halorhabdus amylolytica]|uniref:DUF5518 domain-containing protein n=1 Tax=Halorhabdus amylolytica TaxID=2559573 RepID=UPI0010AA67F8|nr:DUF5518 domain-containing protein [Halorhabdus amylolytica]